MFENLFIYGAVYDDVHAALADLHSFDRLNERRLVRPYDAAVIELAGGLPRVVRRMNRPTLELLPELVARGRPPIGLLAEPLRAGERALVVIGRPELEKAFKRVVSRHLLTAVRVLRGSE